MFEILKGIQTYLANCLDKGCQETCTFALAGLQCYKILRDSVLLRNHLLTDKIQRNKIERNKMQQNKIQQNKI